VYLVACLFQQDSRTRTTEFSLNAIVQYDNIFDCLFRQDSRTRSSEFNLNSIIQYDNILTETVVNVFSFFLLFFVFFPLSQGSLVFNRAPLRCRLVADEWLVINNSSFSVARQNVRTCAQVRTTCKYHPLATVWHASRNALLLSTERTYRDAAHSRSSHLYQMQLVTNANALTLSAERRRTSTMKGNYDGECNYR